MENKKVLIPGEPEREQENTRMKNGIPLMPSVVEDLKQLAEKMKVDFPS